jgi:hypothetical protein
MATTLVKPWGTDVSPAKFEPHATTMPLVRRARLWVYPAAIAVTPLSSGGGVDSAKELLPHPSTCVATAGGGAEKESRWSTTIARRIRIRRIIMELRDSFEKLFTFPLKRYSFIWLREGVAI